MFNDAQKTILKESILRCGDSAQIDMAIEEMAELTKALLKHRRAKRFGQYNMDKARDNVSEEVADVLIMLEQLQMIFCNRCRVEQIVGQKIQRLENRLQEAQNEQSIQQ